MHALRGPDLPPGDACVHEGFASPGRGLRGLGNAFMKKYVSPYNPANLLSLGRVTLVPVFVVLMKEGRELAAFACFFAASLTDFLDGWVARRFGWQTRLGEFIDPLGDKMLTLSA